MSGKKNCMNGKIAIIYGKKPSILTDSFQYDTYLKTKTSFPIQIIEREIRLYVID